jgi:Predicted AAA-ATPase/PD-(D/E)XK nuclease superfamily
MSIQLYPVGRQDFPSIINGGFVYVDKTRYAHQLAKLGGSYFMSKPRRFGKSLFISTLESVFLGKKELFKGMYIYDQWQFEEYPIIRMSFANIGYRELGLEKAIDNELNKIYALNEIKSKEQTISQKFKELIILLNKKYQKKVVILIDEYDKPIIDYLDNNKLHLAIENRDILKSFYSILKDSEPYIKLLFITGVSKFSKVSIFSDLNNLTDISMDLFYNEICGISQEELENNFKDELKIHDKIKIKEWYNGYKFNVNGKSLYNPFSLLNFFFSGGEYRNFWYISGTPTFLMKMCREEHLYKFEEISLNQDDLGNFDIENLKIFPILFQTGYLTIIDQDPLFRNYKLSFPNTEVRESYLRHLVDAYINSSSLSSANILQNLLLSLKTKDEEFMKNTINSAFAQIPYDLWQKQNEQYYHAIVHLLFSLLNVYIFSEVHTKKGRADAIIIHENEIYCMEFKLDQNASLALNQIDEKGYTDRFKNAEKPIHHIGINFSSKQKEVEVIVWKLLNNNVLN